MMPPRRRRAVPPVDEWGWMIAAGITAVVVEIGIRTVGLPRLSAVLGAPLLAASGNGSGPDAPTWILTTSERRRVRATRRIMRHWPFGDTCLRQALVSGSLLRRRSPALVVGVARIDGEIRAHAWLRIDGGVLDPLGAASSYTPLSTHEPAESR